MQSKREVMFERMVEKKKEVRTVRRIVFAVFLVLLIVGAIAMLQGYSYVKSALQPVDPESEKVVTIEVPIGSSVDSISAILEANGLIQDARIYQYYVKFNNHSEFQAGTYDLMPSMTLDEITESLKTGTVYHEPLFTVTIPEGLTLEETAKIIADKTGHTEEAFMKQVQDEAYIDELMSKYPDLLSEEIKGENIYFALEGYLFPSTYPFYEENPPLKTIIEQMLDLTNATVMQYRDQLTEPVETPHKLLTFASLLEEEATEAADRQTIASVFYNRLDENMRLQTDPTVLYGMREHKSRLFNSDYEHDSPYNTYQIDGLPPGPIAGAGLSSIEAAIDPAHTEYLYFLADKEGINHFAKTYEEHLANQDKYIGN